MIIGYTLATAHKYGDILAETHRLRYEAFIQRMGWNIPTWQNMEYDQFDNLSTAYLVWRERSGVVKGTCRLAQQIVHT